MVAYRANLGSAGTYHNVPAVTAFPDMNPGSVEHLLVFDVLKQLPVAFLVMLFNGSHTAELFGQFGKAFLFGFPGHAFVHVSPLVVFTLGGFQKIFLHAADTTQSLEPQLSVLLFILSGFQEEGGNLLVAGLLGYGGEIGLLVPGHGLSGKGFLEILFGFGAGILVFRKSFHNAFLLALRADVRSLVSFADVTADLAFEFHRDLL